MRARNENRAYLTDSVYNNRIQTEELGKRTTINKNSDDGIKSVWMEIQGVRLRSIFDKVASSIYISSADAPDLFSQGILRNQDFIDARNFQDSSGNISMGTRINLRSVK